MKLKTMIATALVAAVVPAAALAETAPAPTPTDKANAATTCKALRTNLGAATFTQTYKTFGACVSKWARAEKANRTEALAECKAEQPNASRGVIQRCAAAKVKAERKAERVATVNAARTCKAERTQLGAAAFATKYGGKANAFGKCVSKIAQAKEQEQEQQPTQG